MVGVQGDKKRCGGSTFVRPKLHHAMVAAVGVGLGLGGLFLREWSVFDVDERMGLYALG
jgi:hypothetical protein